jgi:ABC-type transport system involved in multi-copper enzyme maturation permease subunit
MLSNAFRMEMTKIFRRRMTWVLIGLPPLLVTGLYLLLYTIARQILSDPTVAAETVEEIYGMLCWPQALSNLLALTGGAGLGGLVLVVLAGAMTAQEYRWRTIHLWLSRGLPRSAYLLAKYAGLVIVTLLIVLTTVLAASLLTAWFTQQLTGSFSLAALNLAEMTLSLLRTAYTILPYLGLTVLVAILTRSAAAAIAVGMAYTLLEEVLVQLLGMAGGIWVDVARFVPGSLVAALMQTNMRLVEVDLGAGVNAGLAEPWAAAGGIALYVAGLLGLSLWAFRRQNLTG